MRVCVLFRFSHTGHKDKIIMTPSSKKPFYSFFFARPQNTTTQKNQRHKKKAEKKKNEGTTSLWDIEDPPFEEQEKLEEEVKGELEEMKGM